MIVKFQTALLIFATLFLYDMAALPVFDIGGLPFKFSWLSLIFVAGYLIVKNKKSVAKLSTTLSVFWPLLVLMGVGTMSQMMFSVYDDGLSWGDAVFQLTVAFLSALAFGLGLAAKNLKLLHLEIALILFLLTLIVLIFYPLEFRFVSLMWWRTEEIMLERMHLNQSRPMPLGDGTIVPATTILMAWLTISIKFKQFNIVKFLFLTAFVLFLTILISSRNQMVALFFSVGMFFILSGRFLFQKYIVYGPVLLLAVISAWGAVHLLRSDISIIDNSLSRFERTDLADTDSKASSIARPLYAFERFYTRFSLSPLIGTGFSTSDRAEFNRLNLHNDMFYVLAVSGVLGFAFYLIFIFKIVRYAGPILPILFVFPGLTNSFILHLQAFMLFCFFAGVIDWSNRKKYNFESG